MTSNHEHSSAAGTPFPAAPDPRDAQGLGKLYHRTLSSSNRQIKAANHAPGRED